MGIITEVSRGGDEEGVEGQEGAGEPPQGAQPPPPAPPVWADVEDPTERLALALGLDPRRLAVYTGEPTNDS